MTTYLQYFANLHNVEDVKKHFRKLAMQHHPDHGGDVDTMAEINRQYQEALKACHNQSNANSTCFFAITNINNF
ncbi:MAG: hypothetical protein SWY16_04420 [Cyanobacteriota bacterium]|nr:hypothetical protein [Cyanobacteriota bacterium]